MLAAVAAALCAAANAPLSVAGAGDSGECAAVPSAGEAGVLPLAAAFGAATLLDVTVPLGVLTTPLWDDENSEPAFTRTILTDTRFGDSATTSRVCFHSHHGTHVDALKHFVPDGHERAQESRAPGDDVAALPLRILNGAAFIVDFDDSVTGPITAEMLEGRLPKGVERVLLRTRHSRARDMYKPKFDYDFTALDASGARFMVEHGVKLVGVDYLSVATFADGVEAHRTMLGAGIVALEGLDLLNAPVDKGEVVLLALPLAMTDGDGTPVRVVLAY
uniref:Cyclase family protein n=1 Tax=Prasinoderma coloniale TaxID=156133 RepID=A0A7R9Y705_9VIRI